MVMGELSQETEVLVIGSGPGGYAAAFRAADLGLDVTMVDTAMRPGGVCLYKGCIPSKTFLFLAELIHDANRAETMGITFGKPQIDLEALRTWKGDVIDNMSGGLESLSNRRGVQVIKGRAEFESSDTVRLHDAEVSHIKFRHAIVATGSYPTPFPGTEFKPGGSDYELYGCPDAGRCSRVDADHGRRLCRARARNRLRGLGQPGKPGGA